MALKEIIRLRLINQQIVSTGLKNPTDLVSWFGGIQAQDFPNAKWAIGLRLTGVTNEGVEKEIADKKIIRTWLMRGTLHLVSAKDIHWLLHLLAPRIIAANTFRYRQLEIDTKLFSKFNKVIIQALKDGKQLTKDELTIVLNKAGIITDRERLSHLLHWASLEKLICHGPKRNHHFTFKLLGDSVSNSKLFNLHEALTEIANRYFTSHGPATLQDFVWWSGLTVIDAKKGIEMNESFLDHHKIADTNYYFSNKIPAPKNKIQSVLLLPAFDEYIVGYKNRSAFLDSSNAKQVITNNGIFKPSVVINGQVLGIWKPITQKEKIVIEINSFESFSKNNQSNISSAAQSFCKFHKKKLKKIKFI